MAQSNRNPGPGKAGAGRAGTGKAGSGKAGSGKAGSGKAGPGTTSGTRSASSPAAGARPSGSRQSVAAARRSTGGNNRTQLIIGAVAVAVIIAVIAVGLVLNKKQTAVQAQGYGASTQSVATESAGVVTVTKAGSTPATSIDVYEDALCPLCAEFERQFGQQISKAVDDGALAVNFHMLNFLNKGSFSQDYSDRAAAALLCVAQKAGSQPGLYLAFHSALFSPDNQPAENGTADLTNAQLATLAGSSGAPAAATDCISAGSNVSAAGTSAASSSATLQAATGRVATPTVLHNGAPVSTTVDWLSTLLGKG